jgi:hypothetical protein
VTYTDTKSKNKIINEEGKKNKKNMNHVNSRLYFVAPSITFWTKASKSLRQAHQQHPKNHKNKPRKANDHFSFVTKGLQAAAFPSNLALVKY